MSFVCFFLCLTNCSFICTYFVLVLLLHPKSKSANKTKSRISACVSYHSTALKPFLITAQLSHCDWSFLCIFFNHKFKCVIVMQPVAHQEIPRESSRILPQLSITINYVTDSYKNSCSEGQVPENLIVVIRFKLFHVSTYNLLGYKEGQNVKSPVMRVKSGITHLLKDPEDHGDLLRVEESLRHQRQAGLCIPLQLIVAVVVFNGSNLEQRNKDRLTGNDLMSL